MEILQAQKVGKPGDFVFKIGRAGLSTNAMAELLVAMNSPQPVWVDPVQGGSSITVHGFRSTFKDWSADWPDDLSELALSHKVGSDVRRAYAREDKLERRRPMMQAWAEFCEGRINAKAAA